MGEFKITIPELKDIKVKVYVDDKYIGEACTEQVNKIRIDVVNYIQETNDESILDRLYFLGHEDSNKGIMGPEVKVCIEDRLGNLSTVPWEMAHTRRDMLQLMKISNPDIDW